MSKYVVAADDDDFDEHDHQTSYVFVPGKNHELEPRTKPLKKRKISKQWQKNQVVPSRSSKVAFPALFNGSESFESLSLRHRLFEDAWGHIDKKIKSILLDANEVTLSGVTSFINELSWEKSKIQIPTGLIVTGPNIASQDLLFTQLATRLKSDGHGLVVILRSGDASNLKNLLKKLIRDATNQKGEDEDDDQIPNKDGSRLLNYDLRILHNHIKSSPNRNVIVAFQDSEAFDSGVLSDVLRLFSSWLDRIPIALLLGVATSVELFQERLPRAVIRCLSGQKFDVEQTSNTLGDLFQKVVAGHNVPLHFGPNFVMALQERQHDHVQSIQNFVSSIKYAYMCHFYANALSIFLGTRSHLDEVTIALQPEHVEAIRMLPSFRRKIETLLSENNLEHARDLIESDDALLDDVRRILELREDFFVNLRRKIHLLAALSRSERGSLDQIELYIKAFSGQLQDSDELREFLASIKILTPEDSIEFIRRLIVEISAGDPKSDLESWEEVAKPFCGHIQRIQSKVRQLLDKGEAIGQIVRSKYSVQSKVMRTTVVAQRVQLSREKSSLSELDVQFSNILDELAEVLKGQFNFENPLDQFLHEIWLYDSRSPHREVFTPKPRYAIERALSVPQDYLGCTCCKVSKGLSPSQPPTSIVYQLYLETGGLINVFDLWSAFYAIIGGEDGEECEERMALALFYRALTDLKLLGMVKQSRKKTDHLTKLAWKGL